MARCRRPYRDQGSKAGNNHGRGGTQRERWLKVGDGGIGWHIKALLTRRSSRREKDMRHDEGYGCRVSRARWILGRPADGFAAAGRPTFDRGGGLGRIEQTARHMGKRGADAPHRPCIGAAPATRGATRGALCIRQTDQRLTAGAWQGCPVRLVFAVQLGASNRRWAGCIGLPSSFISKMTPVAAVTHANPVWLPLGCCLWVQVLHLCFQCKFRQIHHEPGVGPASKRAVVGLPGRAAAPVHSRPVRPASHVCICGRRGAE